MHTLNSSTQEAEASESLWIPGKPGLDSEFPAGWEQNSKTSSLNNQGIFKRLFAVTDMAVYIYNPNILEAEPAGPHVWGHLGLYTERVWRTKSDKIKKSIYSVIFPKS